MSTRQPKHNVPGWVEVVRPFAFGGMAGMFATTCIQPIDMIKVRIQLAGEAGELGGSAAVKSRNPLVVGMGVVKEGGVLQLYKGLSAALLRQATYTTARMGIFRTLSNKLTDKETGELTFAKRSVASLAAGAIGSVFGTPADVALVRMQSDRTLPPEQQRGYRNVVHALYTMARQEGMNAWFAGVVPTMFRAMALNFGMLATYDQCKAVLAPKFGDSPTTRFGSSALAGFFAAFFSLPFDFVKTRVQKQKAVNGVLPYKNMVDCATKTFKHEGPLAFYTGFPTYYFRIAPHAMITLLTADLLRTRYNLWLYGPEE